MMPESAPPTSSAHEFYEPLTPENVPPTSQRTGADALCVVIGEVSMVSPHNSDGVDSMPDCVENPGRFDA